MHYPREAVYMALLVCLAPTGLGHCADPLPKLEHIDLAVLATEGWFRASLMGAPVGYVHSTATVRNGEGGPRLRTVEEMSLKVDFGRGAFDVNATTATDYGSDLKPQRIHAQQDEFGRTKTIDAVLEGGQLKVRTRAGDLETEKVLTPGPDFGSELILSLVAAQGLLPDKATYAFQAFVPELEMLVDFEAECMGREDVTVKGVEVNALKVVLRARSIGMEMQWWMDAEGDIVKQQMPAMMNLVIEKVSEEEALAAVAPFTIADHIAVSEPMGSARALGYVRLKAGSPGVPAAELIPSAPLQTVTPLGERDAEVAVRAETEEGLSGHTLPFSGPDLQEFLAPNDTIQSADPDIVAKAKEVIGSETDAWEAAKKLVNWVYANMTKVDHDPRPITASECLKTMKGDCSEHATLLCALARAAGIPSKFVTGVVYLNDGYYYHAWNELYVGRWVSCDPTWGEVTSNAGHLVLASGSLTSESFAKTNLDAVRSMGVLTLEVLEHRAKEN
jgi:transglutaminase-like putative cysteine protease